MKKTALLILSLFLVSSISIKAAALPPEEIPAEISEEADILAVFAAANKQPRPLLSTEKTNLDTLWVLLDDGSFHQFVIMDDALWMYSCGTFSPEGEQSVPVTEGSELQTVVIHRTHKYMEGVGFQDYQSIHTYLLHTREYTPLFLSEENGKRAVAVYGGLSQPGTDDDGTEQMPDSWLLCYSDGSFDQYVIQERQILLFQSGTTDTIAEQLEEEMILLVSD